MKKIKIKKEWIILLIESFIAITLSCFNDKLKILIMETFSKWQLIAFIIIVVAIFFQVVIIYCKYKIENKFSNMENFNKKLIETLKVNKDYNSITNRIFRDIILPAFTQDDESKKIFAQRLYEENINVLQLNTYGIPEEIIDMVIQKYHEVELDKLKSKEQ